MITNPRLRYFIRLDGSGNPVPQSIVIRKSMPRSGSVKGWKDITACIGGCCAPTGTLTADDFVVTMEAVTTDSGNVITESSAASSNGSQMAAAPQTTTTDSITFTLLADGSYTISVADVGNPHTAVFTVVIFDQNQNSDTITVTVNYTP